MNRAISLRMRLTLIILLPVLALGLLAGIWQLNGARSTAADVFNNALLSAALAVANDVAISDGDALSPRTRDILSETSGGSVFYHVYAPDGVIVAGYATPPVGIPRAGQEIAEPVFFEARYQGRPVSGVRLQTLTQIEGFTGIFTTTVWQDIDVRTAFVRDLVVRSLVVVAGLLTALGLIVWFGVQGGLRPLTDLENAIAQRSGTDLQPIRRAVPKEVSGVVATLNGLFGQVSKSMQVQSDFIANAAHQLRNPIAGLLSLAEASVRAKTPDTMKRRTQDLLDAARKTAKLTEQLLLYERAKATGPSENWRWSDAAKEMERWIAELRPLIPDDVNFETDIQFEGQQVYIDRVMLKEALKNLVTNAVLHGGPILTKIRIGARACDEAWSFWVEDDGVGIPEDRFHIAVTRFAQVRASEGSGLGLSITQEIATSHGGSQALKNLNPGLRVDISMPRQPYT